MQDISEIMPDKDATNDQDSFLPNNKFRANNFVANNNNNNILNNQASIKNENNALKVWPPTLLESGSF